jgi:hypothetical protein
MSASLMMALDRARDGSRQPPAPGEHAADDGVVDAELTALALEPLLRRAGLAVDLAWISGVRVDEHELADVVQQRSDHQPVAELVVELPRDPVCCALSRDRVQAEALRDSLPHGGPLEEVERTRAARDREHGPRGQHFDTLHSTLDLAAGASVDLVGEPHHRDRERDVSLDSADDVGSRGIAGFEQPEHKVARLDENGERLECLERRRQPPTMALVVVALAGGVRIGVTRGYDGESRHGVITRARRQCGYGGARPFGQIPA